MSRHRTRNWCLLTLANIFLFTLGCFLFFTVGLPYFGFDHSITASMRGDQIMIIRFLDQNQQVTFWKDGTARRYVLPPSTNRNVTQKQLTGPFQQTIQQLQEDWCRVQPSASSSQVLYEIGLRCTTFRLIHFKLSATNVPSSLKAILEQIPAPKQ
jgi:hypothetical protein